VHHYTHLMAHVVSVPFLKTWMLLRKLCFILMGPSMSWVHDQLSSFSTPMSLYSCSRPVNRSFKFAALFLTLWQSYDLNRGKARHPCSYNTFNVWPPILKTTINWSGSQRGLNFNLLSCLWIANSKCKVNNKAQ